MIRKRHGRISLIVLVFVCIFALPILAEGDVFSFYPEWEIGESVHYQISEETIKMGEVTSALNSTLEISVLEKLADGYILDWVTTEPEIVKETNAVSQLSEKVSEATGQLTLQYRTDLSGTFVEITDLDSIKEQMAQVTDIVMETLETPSEKAQYQQLINMIMGTNAQLSMILSKDITLLHNSYLYGYEYELDQRYEGEVSLPNPWGGQPFPGVVSIEGTVIDGSLIKVVILQELDKEKSAEIMSDFIQQLIAQTQEEMDVEDLIETMELTDQVTYHFKQGANWMNFIEYTRTIQMMGISQVETTTYELIEE